MRWVHLGHPAISASMSNSLVFPFAFMVFLALRGRFLSCCRMSIETVKIWQRLWTSWGTMAHVP